MIRRVPTSTRTDTLLPTRRASDLEDEAPRIEAGEQRRKDAHPIGDLTALARRERRLEDAVLRMEARETDPGERDADAGDRRSEEHTSELQSLMRLSYAVFCSQNKHYNTHHTTIEVQNHHHH